MSDFDRLMKGVKVPTHDWDKPDEESRLLKIQEELQDRLKEAIKSLEYEADAVDSMKISSTLELEELESITFDYCGPSNWIKYQSV